MKCIFLDIDGTLFDPNTNSIPESAGRAIEIVRKNNNKVFLCTGRSVSSLNEIDMKKYDGIICSSGAYAKVNDQVVISERLSSNNTAKIQEILERYDVGYILEGKNGNYLNPQGKECFKEMIKSTNRFTNYEEFLLRIGFFDLEFFENDTIFKVVFYGKTIDEIELIRIALDNEYKLTYEISEEKRFIEVELTNKEVNKYSGICKVLDFLHHESKDTIGIGDSINDIEMINGCEIGIAMGNASDKVKQAADFITTNIDDDGIFNAFKLMSLI